MDDTATGGHPLHAAGAEQADIALVVAMAHAPGQHIGDGLEAAVRMVGKTADIVGRLVRAEFVQHQEGVEIRQFRPADDPGEANPGPVAGRASAHDAEHLPVSRDAGGGFENSRHIALHVAGPGRAGEGDG